MKTTAKVAGYGNLQVVSPYDIQTLQELQLVKEANDHAKLYLTGIIPEEKKDSYIAMATSSDIIEVNEVEDGRVVRNLFTGLIENIGVRAVRGIYYIELEGISLTSQLDIKEKTRSFQDKNMTYTALLDLILKDYPGSDYLDYATNGAKLEGFTLQYKETDWAFIKRMASRFGAVLLPETSSKTPKFSLGVPDGKLGQLHDYHYGVARSLDRYTEATTGHGSELDETAFTHYTTESGQYFALGDKVLFQEKELTVAASTARFTEGGLLYTYTLCQEEGVLQNPIRNEQLTGVSLEGKIIEIRRDTVKVHLDIDKTQDKSKAWWFPYSSVYSTEGADGFHCMPQEGDAVQVYFATSQEDGAVAMSSVRKTGQDSPKMGNPSEKYWGTNFGKEMKLGGSDFVLTAKDTKEGKMFIKLDVEDGIEIHSDKAIMFSAEKDLEIETDTKFEIKAQEAIYLLCKESSIVLDGETDIQGTVLKVDGLIKSPVSVADLEPEPEPEDPAPPPPPPEEKKGFWDSLLDGVQLALDVVGMIPGVGEIADLANAGISLARGDYAGAALSLAACVPFAGWAATGTKFVKKGMNAFETGQKIVKAADKVIDTTKTAMNAIGAVVGKVYTSARNVIANGIDKVANAVKLMKQQMKSTVMAAKKGLQKKIASIKKNVKQGLDNLRDKLPGPSKEFVTPEGIKVNFKEVKDQAHKIELPKNEVQQNYLKVMKEMEEEAAARAAKGPGNAEKQIFGKDGLTKEQRQDYRKKIDEAEARGDKKAANDARYERYREGKINSGKEPKPRDKWDEDQKRLEVNRKSGSEAENKGREALSEHLGGKELKNNNEQGFKTHEKDGKVTRPDSIGHNEKREIDLVHDHKHKTGGKDQVIHNDKQMRAQREMLEDKNGRHVVTTSSDNPNLHGVPPKPRPTGPLGKESDVFYTDLKSGKITHKWESDPDLPGGGRWKKL